MSLYSCAKGIDSNINAFFFVATGRKKQGKKQGWRFHIAMGVLVSL
jgi:hypothetical protein